MAERQQVVVGVDTHADVHVAVALDGTGKRVDDMSVASSPVGFQQLQQWAEGHGEVVAFGVEGTGSWGAGLTQHLLRAGQVVLEVPRPNRQQRRRTGKTDLLDAEAAARTVLAGTASAAKTRDGHVEMIRTLRVARRSATLMRTQTLNQMRALAVSAPSGLRESLRGQSVTQLVTACARLRPGAITGPLAASKLALRTLARRVQHLQTELAALDTELARLTAITAPALVQLPGVGPDVAGALLAVMGDNPGRMRSEAAFARICGVAPLPASSGRTDRHRLNRGGDRQANNALWRIVICRIRARDEKTIAYLERRTAEGLTKREIIRCLKRYVAREVFAAMPMPPPPTTP